MASRKKGQKSRRKKFEFPAEVFAKSSYATGDSQAGEPEWPLFYTDKDDAVTCDDPKQYKPDVVAVYKLVGVRKMSKKTTTTFTEKTV